MKHLKTYSLILGVSVSLSGVADDMVIVTTETYAPFSEELAQMHRQYQKMDVQIMSPEEFLAQSAISESSEGVSFLLFYGDGSLPMEEIEVDGDRFLSDVFWCMGVPDVLVKYRSNPVVTGRIPCRRPEDAAAYNNKVRRYFESVDNKMSCGDCLLLADEDADKEHQFNCEELAAQLIQEPFTHVRKVYLDHYDNTIRRGEYALEATKDALNDGISLLIYAGHGTPYNISSPVMIDNYRGKSLRHQSSPVMFFAACDAGRFSFSENMIAQTLLFNPHGGGIAVIAPSKRTMTNYNQQLAMNFVRERQHRHEGITWGELWTDARNKLTENAFFSINESLTVNTTSFNYLGDPALPVYYPVDADMDININGEQIMDSTPVSVTLDRNHRMTFSGNGTALLKLYGERRNIAGIEYDDNLKMAAMTKSRDGEFEFDLNPSASVGVSGKMEITVTDGGKILTKHCDIEINENTGIKDRPKVTDVTKFSVTCDNRGAWCLDAKIEGRVPSEAVVSLDGKRSRSRIALMEEGGSVHHPIGKLKTGQHTVKLSAGDIEISEIVTIEPATCELNLVAEKEAVREKAKIRIEGEMEKMSEGRIVAVNPIGETVHSRLLTGADSDVIEWNLRDASGNPVKNGLYEMYLIYNFTDRYGKRYYNSTNKVQLVVIH